LLALCAGWKSGPVNSATRSIVPIRGKPDGNRRHERSESINALAVRMRISRKGCRMSRS
jgi:hypothetical protein